MTTTTTTTTTPLSTVIGVFSSHEQADKAIDELRHTRFSYEHIRVVERGRGGFTDTLKGMFTGQAAMASSETEDLVKMGLPEYEAQHYQQELDADHVLVLMNADDRPEDAFGVMRQNGAFEISTRFRMPSEAEQSMSRAKGNVSERNEPGRTANPSSQVSTAQPASSDPEAWPAAREPEQVRPASTAASSSDANSDAARPAD